MFNFISRLIVRYSNWKSILVVFLLFLSLKLLFDFHVVPMVEEKTGGYPAPDINFSTSVKTVKAFIIDSNQEGLDYYRNTFFIVDIFFPFFLCAFLALSLSSIVNKLLSNWSAREIIPLLPVVGMVFDYIESIGIVILISASEYIPMLAQLVVVSFWIKMLFGISSLLLVIVGAFFLGGQLVHRNIINRQ